jgi:outer membrane murein-binding lipoprotein Lpp
MNILTELWVGMPIATYSASRFWSAPTIEATCDDLRSRGWLEGDQLSKSGRTMRDEIEAATDELQSSIISSVVAGCADDAAVDGLMNDVADWSQRCIDVNAFPPDVFKRAAG